jgi:hypothetical protein
MKKLLMTTLILSIAPLCSAPDWTISHNTLLDKVTISVTDPLQEDIFLILAVDSNGILSNFAEGPNAPSDSFSAGTLTLNDYDLHLGYLGQGELWLMVDNSSPYTYGAGDWLTAHFAFASGKTSAVVSLYMLDVEGFEGDEVFLTSHVIPEPITLFLFSLGSLFLYRRR